MPAKDNAKRGRPRRSRASLISYQDYESCTSEEESDIVDSDSQETPDTAINNGDNIRTDSPSQTAAANPDPQPGTSGTQSQVPKSQAYRELQLENQALRSLIQNRKRVRAISSSSSRSRSPPTPRATPRIKPKPKGHTPKKVRKEPSPPDSDPSSPSDEETSSDRGRSESRSPSRSRRSDRPRSKKRSKAKNTRHRAPSRHDKKSDRGRLRKRSVKESSTKKSRRRHSPSSSSNDSRSSSSSADSTNSGSNSDSDYDNFRPKISFGSKLGANVSKKLKRKVVKHNYINMAKLLPVNVLNSLKDDDDCYEMTVRRDSKGPKLKLSKPKHQEIVNISQWSQAWDVFVAIYCTKKSHLNEIQSLMTYGRDVKKLAAQGADFINYDKQYRMDREQTRCSWDTVRYDLKDDYARGRSYNPVDRNRSNQNSFRSQRSTKGLVTPDGNSIPFRYCIAFHTRGMRCEAGDQCDYEHKCPECEKRHGVYESCEKYKQRLNNRQQNQNYSQNNGSNYRDFKRNDNRGFKKEGGKR